VYFNTCGYCYQISNDVYLEEYLQLLRDVGYDFENETTCRIAADYLIVSAVAEVRKNMGMVGKNKTLGPFLPATPTRFSESPYEDSHKPIEIYPE
jgi:hypothetical protein